MRPSARASLAVSVAAALTVPGLAAYADDAPPEPSGQVTFVRDEATPAPSIDDPMPSPTGDEVSPVPLADSPTSGDRCMPFLWWTLCLPGPGETPPPVYPDPTSPTTSPTTPAPTTTTSPTSPPTTSTTTTAPPTSATTTTNPTPSPTTTGGPHQTDITDRVSAAFTDPAGTRSTYHLYTSKLPNRAVRGLVVYLDGDGMYGHKNPTQTWALGGSRGVVQEAGTRGYATLSILTPDPGGTFWRQGAKNAAYVDALIRNIRAELGVTDTWLVSYSGGSQLVTKYLLPAHSATFTAGGGAVITGGGGSPSGNPSIDPALKTGFPMLWYTGSRDNGSGSGDGYDALADARRGQAWYAGKGMQAVLDVPAGLNHSDLGGKFGTVLASQLDKYRPR